ncbi:hypothetical protein AM10699_51430 [Acaryochloris marina MBIC10699]|nr:hypothetical protein AM10699_51430 [Acaryochloris marina MBIC10699]
MEMSKSQIKKIGVIFELISSGSDRVPYKCYETIVRSQLVYASGSAHYVDAISLSTTARISV